MPMLALTIVTMGVMAMVAITFGQALARRQQAQMVVDAAAFAGASEQAKGMNTIARINEKEVGIFNGIVLSQVVPPAPIGRGGRGSKLWLWLRSHLP